MRYLIIITIFFNGTSIVYAQNSLVLKNKNNNKEISIHLNSRVGYVMENNSFVKKGLLNSISDSSIMVGSSPIQLNNLKLIGNISKGSGAAMILTSGLSGALFGFFVLGPSSTTVKSIGVISSFALFTYSIKIGSRNKMRNVKKKWSIRKN